MKKQYLAPGRSIRVFTVGVAATISLYLLIIFLAEPLHTLAVSSTSTTVVSLTVAADISNSCTAAVGLGTITRTGDSSFNTCGSFGYCGTNAATCTISTNDSLGYTLAWNVATGTGTLGARTGTGHLNGFVSGNRIAPLKPSVVSTPEAFSNSGPTSNVTNDARWAARLSSTSTTTGGAGITWGSDGATDTWLNVATGSLVNIARKSTFTSAAGDTENIGFRAIINGTKVVPTDTYKATVTFTATAN